jgi:hypothetical protein
MERNWKWGGNTAISYWAALVCLRVCPRVKEKGQSKDRTHADRNAETTKY